MEPQPEAQTGLHPTAPALVQVQFMTEQPANSFDELLNGPPNAPRLSGTAGGKTSQAGGADKE